MDLVLLFEDEEFLVERYLANHGWQPRFAVERMEADGRITRPPPPPPSGYEEDERDD
jgi:hypothetical protein